MKCMNVLQCKSQKNKENNTVKRNCHKEQRDEAQGPCQKNSIRLSLLHPKLFRCNSCIRVIIHIIIMSNSRIEKKVQSLYQLTNKYHRILCLRHMYFWLICSLSSLQLETIWTNVPSLSTKMTNPQRSIMQLILRNGRVFRFRHFKINPNLPRRCNFYWFDILTHKGHRKRNKVCGMSFKQRDAFYKTQTSFV